MRVQVLKSMLQSDKVPFSVFPVAGGVAEARAGYSDDEQERAIVLISAGGTEDVREIMDSKVNCRAFVLDSHRPLNLMNVSEDNKDVYVIRDADAKRAR